MIFLVSLFFIVTGLFFTYVSVGLARTAERKRGWDECETRLDVLRRQIARMRQGR